MLAGKHNVAAQSTLRRKQSRALQRHAVHLFWFHCVIVAIIWPFLTMLNQWSFDSESENFVVRLLQQPLEVDLPADIWPHDDMRLSQLMEWSHCSYWVAAMTKKVMFWPKDSPLIEQDGHTSPHFNGTSEEFTGVTGQPNTRGWLTPSLALYAAFQAWVRGVSTPSPVETVRGRQSLLRVFRPPAEVPNLSTKPYFDYLIDNLQTLGFTDNPDSSVTCNRFFDPTLNAESSKAQHSNSGSSSSSDTGFTRRFSSKQIVMSRWIGQLECPHPAIAAAIFMTDGLSSELMVDFVEAPVSGCGPVVLRVMKGPIALQMTSPSEIRQFAGHMCSNQKDNSFQLNVTSGESLAFELAGKQYAGETRIHGALLLTVPQAGRAACIVNSLAYAPLCQLSAISNPNNRIEFAAGGYNPDLFPFKKVTSTIYEAATWQAAQLIEKGFVFNSEVLKYSFSIIALNPRTNFFAVGTVILGQGAAGNVEYEISSSSAPANANSPVLQQSHAYNQLMVVAMVLNLFWTVVTYLILVTWMIAPAEASVSVLKGAQNAGKRIFATSRSAIQRLWSRIRNNVASAKHSHERDREMVPIADSTNPALCSNTCTAEEQTSAECPAQQSSQSHPQTTSASAGESLQEAGNRHPLETAVQTTIRTACFDCGLLVMEIILFFDAVIQAQDIASKLQAIDPQGLDDHSNGGIKSQVAAIGLFARLFENAEAVFRGEFSRGVMISNLGAFALVSGLRVLNLLPPKSKLSLLSRLFRRISSDIFHILCLFSIILLTFAVAGMMLFGGRIESFSSLSTSIVTLLTMTFTGDLQPGVLVEGGPRNVLPVVYYLSFGVVVVLLLSNVFISVLSDGYTTMKDGEFALKLKPVWVDMFRGLRRRAAWASACKRKPLAHDDQHGKATSDGSVSGDGSDDDMFQHSSSGKGQQDGMAIMMDEPKAVDETSNRKRALSAC